ncbi:CHAT domain-containing protein [Cryomorpha ignava]|uniref:CHAT domain-containing protein n=1 Tax=Cryomorpha ignava TaxID=101383 RepID=A0A7K3WNK9_9FLAO|nr:CHAT domain-containing protein [Cryomorpha ignava]NEN23237.1 CHAT domain-containing protein [Cryomorpha ignava]
MKIIVYGSLNTIPTEKISDGIELVHDVELHSFRAGDEIIELDGVAQDDPIELHGENDYIEITTLGILLEKKEPISQKRGAGDEPELVILNDLIEFDSTERGLGLRRLFKRIKIFGLNKELAKLTLSQLALRLDTKLVPKEGLFKCTTPNEEIAASSWVSAIEKTSSPILLLLHGTGSNVLGTFGGFTTEGDRTIWNEIKEKYGDNVYGVQHRTLTKSPFENAIMVLEALPKNAVVHMLSCSRGGLVGEILSQSNTAANTGFTDQELKIFEDLDRDADTENMKTLNRLFIEKSITVERFVRVACPAAGTLLASKRINIYFNIMLNLIGLVPFLAGNPIYMYLKEFLIAFVKLRSDQDIVPGLEAMDPASPLIKVLNNRTKTIHSELIVIEGDAVAKGGLMKIIKIRLIDLYFLENNDFVVHSRAMHQGIKRSSTHVFFHQNETVSHFKYFSNPLTQKAILIGLQGKANELLGFTKIDEGQDTDGVMDFIVNRAKTRNLPTIILVPGIMGSKLMANGKRAWAHLPSLARGAMSDLDIDNPNVEPYDLMGSAYKKFVRSMSHSYNIVPFPYDWRKSIENAADLLALKVKSVLDETNKPVHIVAHSLGGLVVHALYNNYKNAAETEVWDTLMKRENSRVLLLGSPLRGSHIIPQIMLREEHFFRILHNLDITNSQKEFLEIIMNYPGILDLLPENSDIDSAGNTIDYFGDEFYERLTKYDDKFSRPALAKLKKALKTRQRFKEDPIQGKNVFYIAGKSDSTPAKLIENADSKDKRYTLIGTTNGDGRVTWDTGITKELKSKTWYMDASHGQMCNKPEYFDAISEILISGKTERLSKFAPVSRGVEEFFEIVETEPTLVSNTLELEEKLFGIVPEVEDEKKLPPVKITLTHGDLGYAKYPVAVGHLKDDGLVSAENVVDKYMDGMLSDYYNAGTYPGNIQTSLVILNNDDGYFKGAVVVGLGQAGSLSKGNLEKSFADSLITLVMKQIEQYKNSFLIDELKSVGVSTLLIGSGYAGLTLGDSIKSLLNGVTLANKEIQLLKNSSVKQISEIEFVEIYEDRVISAAQLLNRLIKTEHYNDFLLSYPIINEVSGKRLKIAELDTDEWWFRLQITEEVIDNDEINPLKFVSITDKAKSEVRILPTQRRLIEKLLASIVTNSSDGRSISKTLFFLIIPPELRDFATDKRDMILMLDKSTASYPWELIYNPSLINKKPISTQSGMIRQLAVYNSDNVKYTLGDSAFVVGNPKVPAGFANLPGALAEAKLAESKLKDKGFNVVTSYEQEGEEVMIKLFNNDYRVMHIAGHGIINEKHPENSGVVLSNGIVLSSLEIGLMEKMPEFVFINCCFSGAIGGEIIYNENLNKLASNIGVAFIEKGVKAIVVAGWAVDDKAAENFADELYTNMLAGIKFGEATKIARDGTFNKFGDTNTWGAYQCYGSPYYELRSTNTKTKSTFNEYVFYKEALVDILNIRSSSDIKSSREIDYLASKLNEIVNHLPVEWLSHSEISQSLGNTFYELGQYDKAIEYLELYEKGEKADFSINGLRNLSNLLMKTAIIKKQSNASQKEINAAIKEAERIAETLANIHESKNILALKGGNYKRKALIVNTAEEKIEALKKARDCYKKSYQQDRNAGLNDYFSLINWLSMEEILEFYGVAKSKDIIKPKAVNKLIKDAKVELKGLTLRQPNFYNLVTEAGFEGYRLFDFASHQGKTEKMIDYMATSYQKAWKLRGSRRKAENIIGHFEFVCDILHIDKEIKNQALKQKLENNLTSFQTVLVSINEIFKE